MAALCYSHSTAAPAPSASAVPVGMVVRKKNELFFFGTLLFTFIFNLFIVAKAQGKNFSG